MPGINQARNNKKGGSDRFKRINKDMMYANSNIGSMYATVKGDKGNCRFEVETLKGEKKYATLCGTVKKGGKVSTDTFVLIEPLTSDESGNYQIIFKYNPGQKKQLEKEGFLNKMVDPKKKEEKEKLEQSLSNVDDSYIVFGSIAREDDNLELINDLFIDNIVKRKKQ